MKMTLKCSTIGRTHETTKRMERFRFYILNIKDRILLTQIYQNMSFFVIMANFPADMLLQFGNKKISIGEKPADGGAGRTASVPQTPEALARQKFLTKALRTLTSEGPAGELARVVCKITRRKVIDRVDNMTADEFASAQRMVNKGLPALAASGLLRCVDLSENLSPEGPVVDWTSAEAFDSWVEAAHAKFKQSKGAAVNGPRNVVVHEGTAALPGSYLQLCAVIREDLSCTLACKTEEELSQFGLTAAKRSAYVSPDSIWLLNRKGSSNVFKLVVKVATQKLTALLQY
ncbi:unnamed protein product [Aphis gossypii]|uniref:Uncharacterized protein n=1 Tax=Aphis gossypii TaxID=80765 RepID=A0A9P0J433_APHGO|nr:unnamed protein product [Aphis gossypii]